MVPEGWSKKRIDELGSVRSGRQRSPHFTRGEKRPYLRVANVYDGFIDVSDVLEMCFTDEEFAAYRLEPGDILLNEGQSIGLVGRCAKYDGKPADCCFQNTLVRFRPLSGTDPQFVRCLFQHLQYTGKFAEIAVQTTSIAHLGTSRLAAIQVNIPPLPEQRAISAILATWDRAIEQTMRLIEAKRRLKQGLMQQLLTGQRRFHGFSKPWRNVRLADLGEVASGATPDTGETRNWGGGIPWVTPSEITRLQSQYITSTERTLTAEGLASCATSLLPVNSLIVCTRATVGDCAVNTVPMAMNQGFKAIIPSNEHNVLFLYYSLCAMKSALMRVAAGSTFAEVSKAAFCTLEIKVPERDEQDDIAAVLASVDSVITLMMKQQGKLQEQKQALMQKILTGQVRMHQKEGKSNE